MWIWTRNIEGTKESESGSVNDVENGIEEDKAEIKEGVDKKAVKKEDVIAAIEKANSLVIDSVNRRVSLPADGAISVAKESDLQEQIPPTDRNKPIAGRAPTAGLKRNLGPVSRAIPPAFRLTVLIHKPANLIEAQHVQPALQPVIVLKAGNKFPLVPDQCEVRGPEQQKQVGEEVAGLRPAGDIPGLREEHEQQSALLCQARGRPG